RRDLAGKRAGQPAAFVSDAAGALDDPVREASGTARSHAGLFAPVAAAAGLRLHPGWNFAGAALDRGLVPGAGRDSDGDTGPGLLGVLSHDGGFVRVLVRDLVRADVRALHVLDDGAPDGAGGRDQPRPAVQFEFGADVRRDAAAHGAVLRRGLVH